MKTERIVIEDADWELYHPENDDVDVEDVDFEDVDFEDDDGEDEGPVKKENPND